MSKDLNKDPIKELLEKAEVDEKKDAAAVAKVKRWNPKEQLKKHLRNVVDPELGVVEFGDLTIGDVFEVNRGTADQQERGLRLLYLMLKKAYPDLTYDEVRDLPQQVAIRLLDLLAADFLALTKKT